MKIWRNAEGREFPVDGDDNWAMVDGVRVGPGVWRANGYELVEDSPEVPAGESLLTELAKDSVIATQVGAPSANDESKPLWKGIMEQEAEFERELADLINRRSLQNVSNTPDFLLARCMRWALDLVNVIIGERDNWYGIALSPGAPESGLPQNPPTEAVTEEFEVVCVENREASERWPHLTPVLIHVGLIPGELYLVRKVKR